jgi:Cdc6-like AAA superfamily ATPase
MRHRRNEVQEQFAKIQQGLTPYGGIFPWAFGVDEDEVGDEEQMLKYRTRDDFADWLASEGGTFYVRGKPGSGKSILMEYLFSHPTTMRELEKRSSKSSMLLKS